MNQLKCVAFFCGLFMAGQMLFAQQSVIIDTPQPVDACNGDCVGSTWTQHIKTVSVSRSSTAKYAKPSATNTADACEVKVQFQTRTCTGTPNDGPHTDIYLTSFCSTCIEDIEVVLKKIILRSHLDDDPLNIMSSTAEVQYFRWIMPSCWSEFGCLEGQRCAAACECPNQNLSINQTQSLELNCQRCCSYSTRRVKKAGCDVVITFNGQNGNTVATLLCGGTFPPASLPPALTGLESDCDSNFPCEPACFLMTEEDFPVIPR